MSNAVMVQSGLVIQGFKNAVLKKATIREREGKKPLVFIDVVDSDTFDTTGDLIVLKEDMSLDFIAKLKGHERKPVKVTMRMGQYNGNTSVAVVDVDLL